MIWEIITSISTLVAVLVALFLPVFRNRRKLVIQVATPGRFTERKEALIAVVNSGGQFITVSRLLIKDHDDHLKEMRLDQKMPITLRPSEVADLHPKIPEKL